MKLLFVTTVYPTKKEPFRGIYIQNRAIALADEGVDVKVAFFTEKEDEQTIDSFSEKINYSVSKRRLFRKKIIIDKNFKNILTNYKPDLVIFFIASVDLENKIVAMDKSLKYSKFFEGRNIYYEYHSNLPKIIQYYSFLKRKRIIEKMDFIFFCSKLLENDFNEFKYKNPKFQAITLTNGFDQNVFKPITEPKIFDTNAFKIIAVGNLISTKGFVPLIESVAIVFKDSPKKVQLTIVGSGSIENAIKACTIPNNITLKIVKQLTQTELLFEIKRHDYFILPSVYESFGCVYLEAMSQGLVTVGCENQGPSLFIKDGINGFLVSDKDNNSLRDFLCRVKRNEIDLEQISKNAAIDSKQYSWNAFAKDFLEKVIL